MQRGDIITMAMAGDYGKPRPAVVIQTNAVTVTDTILVCQISSDLQALSLLRIDLLADGTTGLKVPSQIMVEKIFAVTKMKCRQTIGRVPEAIMQQLDQSLFNMIGLGD